MDNNCDVHFGDDVYFVHDQASGKVITKGFKMGRLFPPQFSFPSTCSFAYIAVTDNYNVWHKKFDIPILLF